MAESKYKGLLYSPEVLGGIGLLTAGLSGGSPDKALPSLLQGMQTAAMFRKQEDEDEKQKLIKEYADQVPADQKNAFLIAPKQWLAKNVFNKDKANLKEVYDPKTDTYFYKDAKDILNSEERVLSKPGKNNQTNDLKRVTVLKEGKYVSVPIDTDEGKEKLKLMFEDGWVESRVNTNASNASSLQKSIQTKVEGKLLSGTELNRNLMLQEIQFQPEFLSLKGKALWKAYGAIDFINSDALNPEQKAFLSNYAEWQQTNLQYFNQYRKEITGVAAGEKEMSWLQASIPSEKDTPTTYMAKLKNQMLIQEQVIKNAEQFKATEGKSPYTINEDGDRVYSKEFGKYLKTKVKPDGEYIANLYKSYRKDKLWDKERTDRFMNYTFEGQDWENILKEYLEDQKN